MSKQSDEELQENAFWPQIVVNISLYDQQMNVFEILYHLWSAFHWF